MTQIEITLNAALNKYQSTIHKIERQLKSQIAFDFSIVYQESDGFCILNNNEDGMRAASISDCLDIIKRDGFLTVERFNEVTI